MSAELISECLTFLYTLHIIKLTLIMVTVDETICDKVQYRGRRVLFLLLKHSIHFQLLAVTGTSERPTAE